MELREFVKMVLADVVSGVKDAQDEIKALEGGQANPDILIQPTNNGRLDVPPGYMLSTQKQLVQLVNSMLR